MNHLLLLAASVSPSPSPSSSAPEIDPDRVSPGLLGLAAVLFLAIAVFVIWKSLNKQLGRVDFDESATERPRRRRTDGLGAAASPTSPTSPASPASAAGPTSPATAAGDSGADRQPPES